MTAVTQWPPITVAKNLGGSPSGQKVAQVSFCGVTRARGVVGHVTRPPVARGARCNNALVRAVVLTAISICD